MRGGRSASAGKARQRRPCPGPRFAPGGPRGGGSPHRTPRCEPPVGVDRYALAGQGPASSERIYNQRPCLQTAQASTFGCGVRERAVPALRRTASRTDMVFTLDAAPRRGTGRGVPCWRKPAQGSRRDNATSHAAHRNRKRPRLRGPQPRVGPACPNEAGRQGDRLAIRAGPGGREEGRGPRFRTVRTPVPKRCDARHAERRVISGGPLGLRRAGRDRRRRAATPARWRRARARAAPRTAQPRRRRTTSPRPASPASMSA